MSFYNLLGMPDNCYYGKDIERTIMFKYSELSNIEKDRINTLVKSVTFQYAIKPERISSKTFENDTTNFDEIQVIELELFSKKPLQRYWVFNLSKSIFKIIPYPILLVMKYKEEYRLFISKFHTNTINSEKNVIDSVLFSKWIDLNYLYHVDKELFQGFKNSFSTSDNLMQLYSNWNASIELQLSIHNPTSGKDAYRYELELREKLNRDYLEYEGYYKYFEDSTREILVKSKKNGIENPYEKYIDSAEVYNYYFNDNYDLEDND